LRRSDRAFPAGEVAFEMRSVYAAFLQIVLNSGESGKDGQG
jgi:hypothetical protein